MPGQLEFELNTIKPSEVGGDNNISNPEHLENEPMPKWQLLKNDKTTYIFCTANTKNGADKLFYPYKREDAAYGIKELTDGLPEIPQGHKKVIKNVGNRQIIIYKINLAGGQ